MLRFAAPAAVLALALALALSLLSGGGSTGPGGLTLTNFRFEGGSNGWSAGNATTVLSVTDTGRNGTRALQITTRQEAWTVADGARRVTDGSEVGTSYVWSAWMDTNRTGLRGRLAVREYLDGQLVQTQLATVGLVRGSWVQVSVEITRQRSGSVFGVRVGSPWQGTTDVLHVDDVVGRKQTTPTASATPTATASATVTPTATATPTPTTTPTTTPSPGTGEGVGPTLSNGCGTTRRGVPLCGAYLGSAYGSNSDPAPMESEMNRRLGVRRTYFTGAQVDAGVRTAAADLQAGRLPWISFKLPYTWAEMAAGRGDTWARGLAGRLAVLPGPVWVAFHHEPEGDGDIQTWRLMQERLAPLVRAAAPNVAFTVVLTGWHELYGDAQYRLDAIWPRVKVDVAGFDVYNSYGVVKDGVMNTKGTDLRTAYFEPISRWAATQGVAWGIAETGFTDRAAEIYPHWVAQTYTALKALNGVAFTYFNTTLNSIANWALTTTVKKASYREAAVGSPVLPLP